MLTTDFKTGSVNWADVGSPDIEAANSFYGGLFGWEAHAAEEFGGYVTYRSDGKRVAGGMQVPSGQGAPAWAVYFQTPDVDATVKAVEGAGGTVVLQPMDVGDLGRMAICEDSAGATFGLWQPGTMKGLESLMATGSLCWIELYTGQVSEAVAFYGAALGQGTFDVSFPGGSYTTVLPADGGEDDMFGGIVPQASDPVEAGGQAHWLPYFAVDDCDAAVAKAKELGGSVRAEPVSMAGVGRFAKLSDPFGAHFAVLKPEPEQG
ncbi:VOC family protein [Streptomyces sp. NPDC002851]